MTTNVQKQTGTATPAPEPVRTGPVFIPAVDIFEREDAVVILADMPGVDEQHVEVSLENDVLTLRGFAEPHTVEGRTLLYGEYVGGHYERSFTLAQGVNRDAITARMKHGVLTLVLPKAEQARPRKIVVQADE